jgi:membrane-bound lytic murein transglycosylase B
MAEIGRGKSISGGTSMMPFRPSRRSLLMAAPLLAMPLGGGIAAPAGSDFGQFLAGVQRDAMARGIRPATIEAAFQRIAFLPRVVELDRKQPEHKMTFAEYFQKVVTQDRIGEARQKLAENWSLLQQVWQRYRVQPRFVVALWGIESNFGRMMGTFNVPAALATLAFDGRRGAMFRAELLAALRILDEGNIAPDQMVGSWAGAMGQCQFMPTTFLTYAVDFNSDGRRDIWNSTPDVLGSIGHYVSRLGWRGGESWGQVVVLPGGFDTGLAGLNTSRPVSEWAQLGVRPATATTFSGNEPPASLVLPDGVGGTALLVYDNFRAIKKWNNSNYFAASVGYIADSIGSG